MRTLWPSRPCALAKACLGLVGYVADPPTTPISGQILDQASINQQRDSISACPESVVGPAWSVVCAPRRKNECLSESSDDEEVGPGGARLRRPMHLRRAPPLVLLFCVHDSIGIRARAGRRRWIEASMPSIESSWVMAGDAVSGRFNTYCSSDLLMSAPCAVGDVRTACTYTLDPTTARKFA